MVVMEIPCWVTIEKDRGNYIPMTMISSSMTDMWLLAIVGAVGGQVKLHLYSMLIVFIRKIDFSGIGNFAL